MRFDAEYSTKPVLLSILFHLLAVTATMLSWPFLAKPTPTAQPLVVVDIVKIAPKTKPSAQAGNVKASPETEQEATRRKPPPPPPPAPPPPAAEPVATAMPEPAPAPKLAAQTAEILPEKPAAKPKLKPKPIVAPKPKPKLSAAQKPKTANIKTPVSRPRRSKQKQAAELEKEINEIASKSQQNQKADEGTGVYQNLTENEKIKEDDKNQEALAEQDKTVSADAIGNLISEAAINSARPKQSVMTEFETSLLDDHISRCWNRPATVTDVDKLVIKLKLKMQRDRNPSEVLIVDERRFNNDRTFRVAANAARRAVLDCKPLPLPLEKYEQWKDIIFNFRPKK